MSRIFALCLCLTAGCRPPTAGYTLSGVAQVTGELDSSGLTVMLSGPASALATTTAHGDYAFSNVVDGSYTVTVTGTSTREKQQLATVVVSGASATATPFTFAPVGAAHGHVSLADGATNRAGVIVFADDGSAVTATDEGGAFQLEGVSTGTRRIQATREGYAVSVSEVAAVSYARDTRVDLTLAPVQAGDTQTGFFRGVARLPGEVEHADIKVMLTNDLHTLTTTTKADGRYELTQVPTGTYSLSFFKGQYSESVSRVLVLAGSDGLLIDNQLFPIPDITLAHGRRIPGTADAVASPSGTKFVLLMLSRARPLEVVDLVAGTRSIIDNEHRWDTFEAPIFSPDESRLLTREFTQNLWSVPLAGGPPVQVGDSYWRIVGFSGDAVVYVDQTGGERGIAGLRLGSLRGGQPRQLATHAVCEWFHGDLRNCPEVSPDGRDVVFLERFGGSTVSFTARSLPIAGGPAVDLGAPTDRMPMMSRDGSRALVFVQSPSGRYLLRSVAVAGGGAVDIADAALDGQLTADGTHVLALDEARTLRSVSSLGGPPTQLATDVIFFASSPDGARVVYYQGSTTSLFAVPIAGGAPTRLATGALMRADFTPHGGHVVFVEQLATEPATYNLKAASVAGGPVAELSTALFVDKDDAPYARPLFSPDGKYVAFFEKPEAGFLLKVARINGGAAVMLPPAGYPINPLWTADGHLLTFKGSLKNALAHQNGAYLLTPP